MFCSNCGKQIGDTGKFCPYCGLAVGGAGNVQQPTVGNSPQQGTYQQGMPNPTQKNGKGWVIVLGTAVVALLIVIVILVAGDGSSKIGSKTGINNNGSETERRSGIGGIVKPPKKEIKVDFTAHEFYNIITGENKIRNEQVKEQLKGQHLTISGSVAGVGRRFLTKEPYVDLYNGTPFNLTCEFSEDDTEQLTDLVTNQKVIITGTVKSAGYEMENCTVIKNLENYTIIKN